MSTLPVDNPGIASVPVSSVGDVARLINSGKEQAKYARMIVFLALGGVFLDAYDLTTLSYGIDDVVREFQLSPLLTGLVTSSIMVGTIVGNIIGGWLTDKYGRYSVFMADMFFFVISAIAAGLAPNVWVLIGARFLMGIGVGIDLPVAMSYLAEFSRFAGKGNKAARLAAWCPMWYAASTVCFLIIFGLYFLLPQEHLDWLWRASLLFGAVPALLIIAVRSRFMNESPLWAANQGDLTSAVRILRDSWGIHAHEVPAAKPAPAPKVSFRVLFEKPYRERTIVAGVMNICISFEYTAIAFFLPSILAQFLGAGVFETISASLGLNALFAFTGGLLGMHLAWKYPSRHVAIAGFALQFVALIVLALVGQPHATAGIVLAIAMLGLWLFAEGFGPGAQLMIYPALSYPTAIRATGVGFSRALSGIGSALLIELAQADSNLPQALRAHFAFVEDQLNQPDSAGRDRWFRRFLDGELVGSGWTEIGAVKLGEVNTRVTPTEGGWRLDGEKFYSTGALYADWIDVFARRSDTASDVIALVSTQQTGVVREDDWDGFGQRLTGSGTTRFTGARVETEHVYDFAQRFRYQTAFYQHVLLATLAGIGLAVERDAAQGVKHRSRMYSHGNAAVPRDDAQVLQVVGQISSWAWATRAAVLQAAESLQQAYVAHVSDDEALIARRNQLAEVEAAQAQVIASDWIPRAATELFNALGASDTRTRLALDRHWRNARTVASHNPVIYKARNIGNWLVNGEAPTFIWQIGNGEKTAG